MKNQDHSYTSSTSWYKQRHFLNRKLVFYQVHLHTFNANLAFLNNISYLKNTVMVCGSRSSSISARSVLVWRPMDQCHHHADCQSCHNLHASSQADLWCEWVWQTWPLVFWGVCPSLVPWLQFWFPQPVKKEQKQIFFRNFQKCIFIKLRFTQFIYQHAKLC